MFGKTFWVSVNDDDMQYKEEIKNRETTHSNLHWFIYCNRLHPIIDQTSQVQLSKLILQSTSRVFLTQVAPSNKYSLGS